MGNYHNFEHDFVERTIKLIEQYESSLSEYSFEEQYNYTLIINCFLGLIILPKERRISYIPTTQLTTAFKQEIGLKESRIHDTIQTLRDLIKKLRHSIAHFDIEVISDNEKYLIDRIIFKDTDNDNIIAELKSNEIVPFLKYYSSCLLENLRRHGDR